MSFSLSDRSSSPDPPRRDRFRGVYDANYAPLLGYALRRARTAEDAADIVAETFLVAWRRLDDIPAGEEARLWLYGVARRVLANQRRGERRRERLEVRLLLEPSVWSPATRDESTVDLEAVARALERLSRRDRDVLELVAWEGLAPRELSIVLGCPVNTARVRLHRARKRFAEELSNAEDGLRLPQASRRLESLGRGEVL
jgi:RNA polymerase sigma-70 factor (ECF subfamily)